MKKLAVSAALMSVVIVSLSAQTATITGAYVEAPTPVFTIVDNSRLELESPVASADLGTIRPNQPVSFTVNSYPGEKFEGRVIEINPAVDELTRSAKVRKGSAASTRRTRRGRGGDGFGVTRGSPLRRS